MSVFFNYNNPNSSSGQLICPFSTDPSLESLKELLIYEFKQIAYYILKLEELSIDSKEIRDKIINYISLIFVNLNFKKAEFNNIIKELKQDQKEIENTYSEICQKRGIICQFLTPTQDLTSNKSDIIKALNEGERQSLLKNSMLSKNKKNLYEIMLSMIQTCCLYLSETDNYNIDDVQGKMAVIKLLNVTNFPSKSDEKWIERIIEFSHTTFRVMVKLKDLMVETYGPVEEKTIELGIKKGPAILVSGHFFRELDLILKATQNENINVYTHNDMLMAHSLTQINQPSHLAGHFQRSGSDLKVDFASFPGPILITKNSQPNLDLIRGRLFTLDKYPAFGMSKIENYDFTQVIKAAKESGGFNEDMESAKIKVGYDKNALLEKLNEIFSKIKSGEIKHLFIIDMLNQYPYKNEYLEEFFDLVPDNHFVISLSYPSKKPNILHLDSYYGYSVIYLILEELAKNFEISKLDLTCILTQCHSQTITHLLNLRQLGIHDLYFGNCCPLTINPRLVNGLQELFGLKYMTNEPEKDFEEILNKK